MEEVQTKDVPPVRLAFRTGYIGDRFFGSQMQADKRTIEGEFIAACLRTDLFHDHRDARFLTAGRTDRGVHSRAQVFAFTTGYPERAVSALNWQLPKDIWITGWARVDPEFHPRYRAVSRTYRYYFSGTGLDPVMMDEAAVRFTGCHDFSPFARVEGRNPQRNVIGSRVFRDGDLVCFEVTAESFLWHMVRFMASALLLVGRGDWSPDDITRRFQGEAAGALSPAPPNNLVLWEVNCGIPFIPVRDPGPSGRYVREQKESHMIMAKICEAFEAEQGIK